MKNFNIKSKKGFTLIELLVVIGILAVLAAIAIPSVAGLIDKANVSADNTNANEMTNAMERFVSEYEMYCQDIASGKLDINNLDSAQGRVYNVTKAETRAHITLLESETGFNGIRIDRDTKYPQNQETTKTVIENYMKTSSSTFETKQSDKAYWYNTVTGYTVIAEHDCNTEELYLKLPSEVRYGASQPASLREWINLSSDIEIPDISFIDMRQTTAANGNNAIEFVIKVNRDTIPENTKIYSLFNYEGNVEDGGDAFDIDKNGLSIENAKQYRDITDKLTSDEYKYTINFGYDFNDTRIYARLCYEYEENGTFKRLYTPIVSSTYNELSKN